MKYITALIVALFTISTHAQTNILTDTSRTASSISTPCQTCVGYFLWQKTIANGWGYATNSYPLVIIAGTNILVPDTNYVVEFFGKNGETKYGCNGTLTVTNPASSKYRFAVYKKSGTLPASYQITTIGFLP